jgi:LacI family transcriptional regulator
MVTIKQVSELSGVSKSTVSRVVANNGQVSAAAREKVEKAIEQLGYRPNSFAQGLVNKRSNVIGVVVVNVGSPFYCELLGGIQDVFHGTDKHLMVTSGYGTKKDEAKVVSSLLDRQVDGLILFLEGEFNKSEFKKLVGSDLPVVFMGRDGEKLGSNSVQVNNVKGGRMAAQHLIESGHRKIVHLAGPQHYHDAQDRLKGFWEAVDTSESLDRNDCIILSGEYSEEFGYSAIYELHGKGIEYTAICSGDDDIAAGCYVALRELGKHIPNDISIIGYDDNVHAKHMYPALTTIRQPINEVGRQASQRIIDMLSSGSNSMVNSVITPTLVERQSVKQMS